MFKRLQTWLLSRPCFYSVQRKTIAEALPYLLPAVVEEFPHKIGEFAAGNSAPQELPTQGRATMSKPAIRKDLALKCFRLNPTPDATMM